MSSLDLAPFINANGFPWWVRRKVGQPILLEANFSETYPNTKWGALFVGTGTVTADTTNLRWGGGGSAKMLTSAASLDGSEIKTTITALCDRGDLLAFEMKWAQSFAQGTTEFQFGLESRSHTAIKQARFSWQNSRAATGWQWENAAGTFADFSALTGDLAGQPNAVIENPAINTTAGTPVSWARVVIDPFKQEHVSFECPYVDLATGASYLNIWNMRGLPLISNGAASRCLYLPFTYVITHSANAEAGYTADWCMSIIPKDLPGGPQGRF
jgi:hypothetical protein